jgi:hypothetical protein
MRIVAFAVAFVLLALCAFVSAYNNWIAFKLYVLRRDAESWIPFVGGISGVLALAFLPVEGAASYWWVPLIADWGSIPGTIFAIAFHLLYYRDIYGKPDRNEQPNDRGANH